MHRRPLALLAAAVLAASLGTGCAPAAEPAAFADDEEAFAAAEATYRAYMDAVNEKRENPESSADPLSFLTGHALEASIMTARRAKTQGIRLQGASTVVEVELVDVALPEVLITACIDASAARVINDGGQDVTPPDRGDRWPATITLVHRAGVFLISESTAGTTTC